VKLSAASRFHVEPASLQDFRGWRGPYSKRLGWLPKLEHEPHVTPAVA
jgi:hypothetical protein